MKCSKCKADAVISDPALCKKHFIAYFEKKVFSVIRKHKLFGRRSNVCVATSGGKDSTTVLYLTRKYLSSNGSVSALIIDEGIKGYRDKTLTDLVSFCKVNSIKLHIVSFAKEFGKTLDDVLSSGKIGLKPCTVCGTLRRYLLNKHSRGYDVIVTGHNMDDESQAVLMNVFRDQLDILARGGPATGVPRKGFVQRVKPLYLCTEKEVALYTLLMGFDVSFNECPYIKGSYRSEVRSMLNSYSSKYPRVKVKIMKRYLKILSRLKKTFARDVPDYCDSCGDPSSGTRCNACKLAERIRDI